MDSSPNTSAEKWLDLSLKVLGEIASLQNLERTLHRIVETLVEGLQCKTCAIIQINPRTELLEITNFHGLSWQFCKEYRRRIKSALVTDLIWKGEEIYIPDKKFATKLAEEIQLDEDFRSCFCVQLTAANKPLGILYLSSAELDYFGDFEKNVVRLFARMISLAILKSRLLDDVKHLVWEDEESGAEKFNYFYSRLQESFSRAFRLKENLSLIVIDVEKYTEILSMYGSDISTTVIRELVSLIRTNIRRYDGLARYGADELILLLPGNSRDDAYACACKIVELVKENTFTREKLKINVTCGVATYPDNATTLSGLLKAVNNSLVEAKRHPSERVICQKKKFD